MRCWAPAPTMLGGRFSQAFFFSIQTFATIGYGQIGPNGMAANLVVTVEALVGLMYQALATGLLFARFTRPTAALLFSRHAVVGPYNDGQGLMFRIVNRRRNEIIELEAQVLFSALEPDNRGRHRTALLAAAARTEQGDVLSPLLDHRAPDRQREPAGGRTPEDLERAQAEILVLLSGIDEAVEQTVHARSSYRARRDRLECPVPIDVPAIRCTVSPRGRHQPCARDRTRVNCPRNGSTRPVRRQTRNEPHRLGHCGFCSGHADGTRTGADSGCHRTAAGRR